MSKIEIKELTFGFDSQATRLFNETSLNLDTSWKLGLIGRNGRGKTTLLRLLLGELPYQGTIAHQLTFTYFPQTITDKEQLTLYALQEKMDFAQWELERELNLLQADPDILWRPFSSLSGGEQTKALLAALFIDDAHFPLIDEPTNHLDITGRRHVAEYLKRKKQGFIVISHDRGFMDDVIDHTLAIEKSRLVLYQGNFSTYEEQKKRRDEFEQAQNEKIGREVSRLKKTAADKADWSLTREGDNHGDPNVKGSGGTGHDGFTSARAARTMKRSKAIIGRMESQAVEKEQLLKDIEHIEPLKMNFQPTHKKRLLRVENLVLSYDGKPLFQPLTFELVQGEQLAITGPNGSGKSSLIQYLMGSFSGEASGNVVFSDNATVSYLRQNYDDNTGTLTAFAEKNHVSYQDLLNNLKKLGMERTAFHNRIEDMSMGQQKKVELAKSLAIPAELYLWDEPLNYLDVFNHEQIEELLQTVKPTLLLVEHDQHFIDTIATKVITLQP